MKFKTFIINMDKNPERLEFMSKQLNGFGIGFTRLKAIDGSSYNFNKEYNESLYKEKNNGRTMSNGEKGCALSHKTILKKILEENIDYALVLEDDVELSDNFKNILDQELQKRINNNTSWEYLSFNYPSVGTKAIILWLFLFFTMFNKEKTLKKYLRLPIYFIKFLIISTMSLAEGAREYIYKKIYKYGKPSLFFRPLYLAGCYLVTKEGAKKLLDTHNGGLLYTADRLPNVTRIQKKLKFYAFVPLTAIQRRDQFESNSAEKNFGEKVKRFMGGRLLKE